MKTILWDKTAKYGATKKSTEDKLVKLSMSFDEAMGRIVRIKPPKKKWTKKRCQFPPKKRIGLVMYTVAKKIRAPLPRRPYARPYGRSNSA